MFRHGDKFYKFIVIVSFIAFKHITQLFVYVFFRTNFHVLL